MTDDEIKSNLQDRVDRAKRSVGIVVGIVDPNGSRIISYGKTSLENGQPVNGDTVYDLASVTKVFTASLLAEMAAREEVSMDDPISKYLSKSVKTPAYDGQEILLRHLSS